MELPNVVSCRPYLLIVLCLLSKVSCVDVSKPGTEEDEFFPFDKNDLSLPRDDDKNPVKVCSEESSFWMGKEEHKCMFININGVITFERGITQYTPIHLNNVSLAMIAPFWADVYTGDGVGTIYYRQTTDNELLGRAENYINSASKLNSRFKAKELVIVTWDHVGFYQSNPLRKTNTFQCVLVMGEKEMFAIVFYSEITWTTGTASGGSTFGLGGTPALVGYTTTDHKHSFVHPWSLSDKIIDVNQSSNIGEPGTRLFHFGDQSLFVEDPDNEGVVCLDEVITEEITSEGISAMGKEEDVGIIISVPKGTVEEGEAANLTTVAVMRAKVESTVEVFDISQYDPVSTMYKMQKNEVHFKEKIKVTIQQFSLIRTEEDRERTSFYLFNSPNITSDLKLVAVRMGVFFKDSVGNQFGVLELADADLQQPVYIQIIRNLTGIPGGADLFKRDYIYSMLFFSSNDHAVISKHERSQLMAIFCMCRNERSIIKVIHRKIVKKYFNYGITAKGDHPDTPVRIAQGSDRVRMSHTPVLGWTIKPKKTPEILQSLLQDFHAYTNATILEEDPGFPPSILYSLLQEDSSVSGDCTFNTSGLEDNLEFNMLLGSTKAPSIFTLLLPQMKYSPEFLIPILIAVSVAGLVCILVAITYCCCCRHQANPDFDERVNQIAQKAGVDVTLLEKPCSDKHFLPIAKNLINWTAYADYLELTPLRVQSIITDISLTASHQKPLAMLKTWFQKNAHSSKGHYRFLLKACLKVGDEALAKVICKLLKEGGNDNSSSENSKSGGWVKELDEIIDQMAKTIDIDPSLLDQPCSPKALLPIAKQMTNWSAYTEYLGLTSVETQNIHINFRLTAPHQKALEMLKMWQNKCALIPRSHYRYLARACFDVDENAELAGNICRFANDFKEVKQLSATSPSLTTSPEHKLSSSAPETLSDSATPSTPSVSTERPTKSRDVLAKLKPKHQGL